MSVSGIGGPRAPRTIAPQQKAEATAAREAPKATQAGFSTANTFEADKTEGSGDSQKLIDDFKKKLAEGEQKEGTWRAKMYGEAMLDDLLKQDPGLRDNPEELAKKLDEIGKRASIMGSTGDSQMKAFFQRLLEQTKKAFKWEA